MIVFNQLGSLKDTKKRRPWKAKDLANELVLKKSQKEECIGLPELDEILSVQFIGKDCKCKD
jgi:hypothetical protein